MDLIFELIFRGLIIDFFGKKSRFFFFKIIGKPKSMKLLSVEKEGDGYNIISQHLANMFVGFFVFIGLSVLTAYLYFTLF